KRDRPRRRGSGAIGEATWPRGSRTRTGVRRLVPSAQQLLAIGEGRTPRRPEASIEDTAQASAFFVVLYAPDLPADDRLSGETNDTASDSHGYLDIKPISRRQTS